MVLGIEMNLSLLEDDLDIATRQLCYLHKIEDDLMYNINLHKSGAVISVAKEYKKSIDELGMVRKEIIKHRNQINTIKIRIEKKLESYEYYLSELESAFDDLNREPVILLFRRKDDGKKTD